MKIPSPDDPRFTGYVLGEMDPATAQKFESSMADDPAIFDEIHEIRNTTEAVAEAVSRKPALALTDTQRHRILRLAEAPAPHVLARPENIVRPAFWNWFGKFAAGAAAAGIAVAALVFAYQSGYKSGIVEKGPEENPVSKDGPLPGETPSIRITVVDDGGESRPSSRPISSDSIIPVSEGRQDAFVAAVPKIRAPESPDPSTKDPVPPAPENDLENGTDPGFPAVAGTPSAPAPSGKASPATSGVMENQFVEVSSSPRSSFPLRAAPDSYAAAAGSIRGAGEFPDPSTVAVEQIVNAFSYRVPGYVPTSNYSHPFAAGAEVFSCPWNPENRLVRITVFAFGQKSLTPEESKSIAENIELLVEFNRSRAARYRLIGFDGAGLLSSVSAASPKARSLGSGETVTALYEVVPAKGTNLEDELRYTPHNVAASPRDHGRELLCLSISYTRPDVPDVLPAHSGELVIPVIDPGLAWNRSAADFQFAAATAAFGMVLSGSEHVGTYGFAEIDALATRALRHESDRSPQRSDFLELVRQSALLSGSR